MTTAVERTESQSGAPGKTDTPPPVSPSATDADGVAQLRLKLTAAEDQIDAYEETISDLERRHSITEALYEARAIDIGTARLLADLALKDMDEPDVDAAIAQLHEDKAYLFAPSASPPLASAQSPALEPDADEGLTHAAAEAHATGNRRDLLRYLRLKRTS